MYGMCPPVPALAALSVVEPSSGTETEFEFSNLDGWDDEVAITFVRPYRSIFWRCICLSVKPQTFQNRGSSMVGKFAGASPRHFPRDWQCLQCSPEATNACNAASSILSSEPRREIFREGGDDLRKSSCCCRHLKFRDEHTWDLFANGNCVGS